MHPLGGKDTQLAGTNLPDLYDILERYGLSQKAITDFLSLHINHDSLIDEKQRTRQHGQCTQDKEPIGQSHLALDDNNLHVHEEEYNHYHKDNGIYHCRELHQRALAMKVCSEFVHIVKCFEGGGWQFSVFPLPFFFVPLR